MFTYDYKREHCKALTHATCLDDRMSKFYLMFGTIIHQTSPGPSDDLKANEGIPKALTPVVIAIPEETSNSLEEGQTTCAHPLPLQREPTSRPSPKRVESRATRQSEADKALQVRVTQTKDSKKGSYQHYAARNECVDPRDLPSVLADYALPIPHVCANDIIWSVLISRFTISGQ